MTRRPPRSTLFPYTTALPISIEFLSIGRLPDKFLNSKKLRAPKGLTLQLGKMFFEVMDRDRKSTRLNSSHVRISYAVFCLKKKKSNIIQYVVVYGPLFTY